MANTDKPVSTVELKTFIDAVEFAADAEDWVPSKRQWERIRKMIDRLEETAPAAAQQAQPMQIPQYTPPPLQYSAPPMMAPGGLGGQMVPQGLPQGVPMASGMPQHAIKTPDIDNTSSPYRSSFA